MNIVFFGSDDFAAAHLEALLASAHKVRACVTQPDKPKGRGLKTLVSPVKGCAQSGGIPVFQPVDLKDEDFLRPLRDCGGDLFVVIAYGRFLPRDVLQMPKTLIINVHSSLLPQYRGAAPINWAVINGGKETGVTIMRVTSELDAGEIIAQEKIKILDEDTSETLRAKMTVLSPPFLLKTIDAIAQDAWTLTPQDSAAVTWAPKLTKELGHICWDKKAVEIHNLARGLLPWPAAYTFYGDKFLKILETAVVQGDFSSCRPGEVVRVDKEGFVVACGEGGLCVRKVHLQASRPMEAYRFVIGHKLEIGFVFKNPA